VTRHHQESAAPSAAVENQVEPNEQSTWPDAVLEALDTHGLGAMSEALRLIVNEATGSSSRRIGTLRCDLAHLVSKRVSNR
jgi:hypothetical protein